MLGAAYSLHACTCAHNTQQMHISHRTIQQGNRNDSYTSNDNDDGIDGTDSSGTDGGNDNNGTNKKVR